MRRIGLLNPADRSGLRSASEKSLICAVFAKERWSTRSGDMFAVRNGDVFPPETLPPEMFRCKDAISESGARVVFLNVAIGEFGHLIFTLVGFEGGDLAESSEANLIEDERIRDGRAPLREIVPDNPFLDSPELNTSAGSGCKLPCDASKNDAQCLIFCPGETARLRAAMALTS